MTATLPAAGPGPAVPHPAPPAPPVLDVVVPVHNEEADLEPCVRKLHGYLLQSFPYPFRITIADNASTDATPQIAARLAAELAGVTAVHLPQRGRGRALHAVWSGSDAQVLAYLDVDLSTDLAALPPLVAPLLSGHSDLAIGTRLARGSRVTRGLKRELLSRGYNLLLRGTLAAGFSDAQCGFKAIRAGAARGLLPLVRDTEWFFDTELLVLAQRAGLRIHEVPVDWVDDPDSRVDIVPTVLADLRGIARLAGNLATGRLPIHQLRAQASREQAGREQAGREQASREQASREPAGLPGQLARFGAIGVLSTLAYLALFLMLRGAGAGAQAANLVALISTAVANTTANRRVTFGLTGRRHAARHHLQGLAVFAIGLAMTSGSLVLLDAVTGTPSRLVEIAVLLAANLAAALARFALLRHWVFAASTRPTGPSQPALPPEPRSAR